MGKRGLAAGAGVLAFLALQSSSAAVDDFHVAVTDWMVSFMFVVPMGIVEAVILGKRLAVGFKTMVRPVAVANVVSALIALPGTVAAYIVLSLVGSESYPPDAWNLDLGGIAYSLGLTSLSSKLTNSIVALQVCMLVPFFVLSLLIEYAFLAYYLRDLNKLTLITPLIEAKSISFVCFIVLPSVSVLAFCE